MKQKVAVHGGTSCHPSTWEVEGGRSGLQNLPQLFVEFKVGLVDIEPAFTKKHDILGIRHSL